jgi:tRNA pseudouridine65 synthase
VIEGLLEVLYRDEDLVAVYKPAGWLVHRTRLDSRERHCVLQNLRDQLGQRVYPVHRLDRPTAGLLLFALSSAVARELGAAFTERRVHKRYLGLARGYLNEAGVIDHELDDPEERRGPRAARTLYRPLARAELPVPSAGHASSRYTLLELEPQTGRRHQLRRHLKHIAHPLVGDTTHGDGVHNRIFRVRYGWHRLALCAVGLTLEHPRDGRALHLICTPDAAFIALLGELGADMARLASRAIVPAA